MVGQAAVSVLLSAMAEPLIALITKPDYPPLGFGLDGGFVGEVGD